MARVAGPTADPLANWHGAPLKGMGVEERIMGGTIVFSTAGAVSAVSGVAISAVTQATGVYRVYVPKNLQMFVTLTYGTTVMFANDITLSSVSAPSGYFDLCIASAAGLSSPSSGDFAHIHIHARTRKAAV